MQDINTVRKILTDKIKEQDTILSDPSIVKLAIETEHIIEVALNGLF